MKKILLLTLFLASCAHNPPPVNPPNYPPPTTPNPMRTVAIVAVNATTGSAYIDDNGPNGGKTCILNNGYCEVIVNDLPKLQTTYIVVQADGFEPYRQENVILPAGNVQVWLGAGCGSSSCVNLPPLMPVFVPLLRLVTNQWFFSRENGRPITLIGADSYALYQQYLDGVDIKPVLDQLVSLGFNYLRVFGSYNGSLGHFVPTEYGDQYFLKQIAFAKVLAQKEFYYEFVAFADATTWIPDVNAQLAHWNNEVAAVAPITNVILEAGNELNQPINRLNSVQQLPMPQLTNSSHGSNGSGEWGVIPFWHYVTLHVNSESEWQRKYGHNCFEIGWLVPVTPNWRGPCIGEESPRPDQDGNLTHFHDAARACALLAAGCVFHSNSGKASQVLTGIDLQAATAFAVGALKVPIVCQNQPYKRIDPPLPGMLRTYQRGDDPQCLVNVGF